jgi:hypothetical protein
VTPLGAYAMGLDPFYGRNSFGQAAGALDYSAVYRSMANAQNTHTVRSKRRLAPAQIAWCVERIPGFVDLLPVNP